MIVLDYKDPRPVYEQIVDRFTELIERGVLKNNEKLPSVRQLAMELSINPNTVQKAYAELERREYIYTRSGLGAFVSHDDAARTKYIRKEEEKFCASVKRARDAGIQETRLSELMISVFTDSEK